MRKQERKVGMSANLNERFDRILSENPSEGKINDSTHEQDEGRDSFKFVDPKEYAKNFITPKEEKDRSQEHETHKERVTSDVERKKREGLDYLINEIKGGAQAFGRGVTPIVDLLSTPGRKKIEEIKGHKVPTFHDAVSVGYEEPSWNDQPLKSAIHEGLGFAGSVIPGAGVGSALMKAGQVIPKAGKWISKAGELFGGKALNQALKGNASHLAEMTASAIPMGMAAKAIKEESGIEPLLGDILGSVVGGLGYGVARHPGDVVAFSKRVLSGDVGRGVRHSFLKNLKESVGKDNIDDIIAKIEAYEPVLEGHQPTVAEMMTPTSHTEPLLPQVAILERSQRGTPAVAGAKENTNTFINQSIQDLENPNASIEDVRNALYEAHNLDKKAVEDILTDLQAKKGGESSAQDVGETLGGEVNKHLDEAWKKRKAESEPHWKAVEKDERLAGSNRTKSHLDETLKIGIDDPVALSHYNRVRNLLGHETKSDLPLSEWHSSDPERLQLLRDAGIIKDNSGVRISQLDAERKRVLNAYNDAKNSGDHNRARYLKELIKPIEQDLFEASQDAKMAVAKYAEFSPPINKIENVPSNAQMINKQYGEPQVLQTKIGEDFTMGKYAPEKIENLHEAFDTRGEAGIPHKEAMNEAIESHAGNELFNKVVTKDGLVDLRKLNQYENTMTGVQKVSPEFVDNLKALAAAQANLENQFGRTSGGARDILLEGESTQVVKEILKSNNKQKALNEVLERLKKVGHEDGREGMINGVLEHMQESIRGRGGDARVITPTSFKGYFRKHRQILKQLLDPEQYRTLEGIGKIMGQKQFANEAGSVPGSHTKHLLSSEAIFTDEGRGLVRKLLHYATGTSPLLDMAFSAVSKSIGKDVKTLKSEMLQKFLTNSEQALKDLHGAKNIPDREIMEYAKHSIPRNILSYLISD